MAGLKVQLLEEYLEQEQALVGESHRSRDELHHLHRLILIKADEREHKSRELLKAQVNTFIKSFPQNPHPYFIIDILSCCFDLKKEKDLPICMLLSDGCQCHYS